MDMLFYSLTYLTGFKSELRKQNTCNERKQIRKEEKQNKEK